MNRYRVIVSALILLLPLRLIAAQTPTDSLTETQIRELIRKSADKDEENTRRERDYTYIERTERRRRDSNGNVKSRETLTYEVMVLAGEQVQKLIARDDKLLPEKEAQKEDARIQDRLSKYQKEGENDRRKRLEKEEKETEESRHFVGEIADAFRFRFVDVESLDGRTAYVIDAEPLPGYKPRVKHADILTKLRFRAWIDKADSQWAKVEAESIDTISLGLFLVRMHKGSKLRLEQVRVNDEVWLPRHFGLALDARIFGLKNMDVDLDVTFRDYRKFVAETTIIPVGEFPDTQ